mmetsp:Transcript_18272/g.50786  ORF Transcript_18272/g.50786 Transcript_18272/m.50786 type:complete len:244 (-) Transcript_18272:770-1501(-)
MGARIMVMSSQYWSSNFSQLSRALCKSCSHTSWYDAPLSSSASTNSPTSSFFKNSHTPSLHASMYAFSKPSRFHSTTSGSWVTPCSLTARSPNDRDMQRPEKSWPWMFTRSSTKPSSCSVRTMSHPMLSSLSRSPSRLGLWSMVCASTPRPGQSNNALVSPAVATQTAFCCSCIKMQSPVQPATCNSMSFAKLSYTRFDWTFSKAWCNAALAWPCFSIVTQPALFCKTYGIVRVEWLAGQCPW